MTRTKPVHINHPKVNICFNFVLALVDEMKKYIVPLAKGNT